MPPIPRDRRGAYDHEAPSHLAALLRATIAVDRLIRVPAPAAGKGKK